MKPTIEEAPLTIEERAAMRRYLLLGEQAEPPDARVRGSISDICGEIADMADAIRICLPTDARFVTLKRLR